MLKRQAIASSGETYILADASKFGEIAPITFGEMQDAMIITDKIPQEQYKKGNRIVEVENL
jgi:DeoR family fructose operon transcriptional repressor